ncbi:hypothetical protein ACMA5I_13410 [Paracoccaceae bacterium GXU_MW_L88]
MKNLLVSALVLGSLAACDSYTAQQYQTNPQNTIALQNVAAQGKRASVVPVTLAEGVDGTPTCRLAGPLDLGGKDAAAVIQQALQAELLAAGVYSQDGTPLTVTVTELTPDSFTGDWTIALHIASSKGAFNVVQVNEFSTSFSGAAACNNTAMAFNRALSATILAIVQHPQFSAIL